MVNYGNDVQSIKQTLQYFFDGFDSLDGELTKKAFHPKAQISDVNEVISITEWCSRFEEYKKDPAYPANQGKSQKNILSIDVTGQAASVKMEWVFPKFKFTDYYNLIKIEEKWYITDKIWHTTYFD